MSEAPIIWVRYIVDDESLVPFYATDGSAGCDLRSSEDVIVKPGRSKLVGTGLKIELPGGFEAQVRPRSGLAMKYGITVLNSPGTIDPDYKGEIKVILFNTGDQEFEVRKGDRIAQLVFARVFRAIFQKTEEIGRAHV